MHLQWAKGKGNYDIRTLILACSHIYYITTLSIIIIIIIYYLLLLLSITLLHYYITTNLFQATWLGGVNVPAVSEKMYRFSEKYKMFVQV